MTDGLKWLLMTQMWQLVLRILRQVPKLQKKVIAQYWGAHQRCVCPAYLEPRCCFRFVLRKFAFRPSCSMALGNSHDSLWRVCRFFRCMLIAGKVRSCAQFRAVTKGFASVASVPTTDTCVTWPRSSQKVKFQALT